MKQEEPMVVIDRRHGRETEVAPVVVKEEPAENVVQFKGNSRKWKTRAYMIAAVPGPNNAPVFLGRGFGVREDGFEVLTDYVLPIFWEEDFNWIEAVNMQLQTYLGCKCSDVGPCEKHAELIQKWGNDGMSSWQREYMNKPPDAVEAVMRANQRRQSGIIQPGR